MFTKSVGLYDAIYDAIGKDYAAEVQQVHGLIQAHKRSQGNSLLDVACGTGRHLEFFQAHYRVEGLDLEEAMLQAARNRNPTVPFHRGDMRTFQLARRFDALVCLFSAIGYVGSLDNLNETLANFSRHLVPGGVLVVEPWIRPDDFRPGGVHATYVDQPELKVARMNLSRREGNLVVMKMHYLVGTPEGITNFTELHELAMFTRQEFREAYQRNGLEVTIDEEGLIGRGLVIGVKT